MKLIVCLGLLAVLGGCAIPGDTMGGRPAMPIPMAPPIGGYDPNMPMLDDPEAVATEWSETILADSVVQAQRQCEARAKSYNNSTSSVKVVRVVAPRSANGKTYTCVYEGRAL